MTPTDVQSIKWKDSVQDKDLEVAEEYLALRLTPKRAKALMGKLRDAELVERRVNDLFRACDREPLDVDDRGVKWKLDKVLAGKKLTPALVVSFDGVGADICQAYHELSLVYRLDPFANVPVFIAYEEGA